VIGAGISSGQLALHLIEKGFDGVLLVSNKAIQVSDFDVDPGWLGPKCLDRFHRQSNDQRRQQIMAARAKGSVPRDMKLALDKATALNQLMCIVDDITDAKCQDVGALLVGRHGRYDCQKIVLATGFTENRPGNGFISQAIKEFDLKTAACGFPVIGPSLHWHERIFVTGPFSELQIGPAARNIAGARYSGRRITAAINKESIPGKAIWPPILTNLFVFFTWSDRLTTFVLWQSHSHQRWFALIENPSFQTPYRINYGQT